MREKQFLVIKIVKNGIRPLRLSFSEVEELLEREPNDEIRAFIETSTPGQDFEFKSGFIICST